MRLHEQLELKQVRLLPVKMGGTKEESISILPMRAALTPEVAEAFGCKDLIFAGGATPRSGVDKLDLEGGEVDCEIHFQHDSMSFTAIADTVGGYVAKMEGTGPVLLFKIKLTGFATTVAELLEKIHVDPLDLTFKPNQMDLGLKKEEETSEAADDDDEDDTERLVSPEQAADTAPENDGPVLVSASLMGGTHQRGTRKNPRRQPGAKPILEGDDLPGENDAEVDFLSDLAVPEGVQ